MLRDEIGLLQRRQIDLIDRQTGNFRQANSKLRALVIDLKPRLGRRRCSGI
jgi:hypothetical protein